ncbi:MAG: hypothetical protein PWP23_2669 [Candidatus Sumerlaeota bacterium]|nr:hypothetical protein [Candidatus Sumerlaeota bacterium]
MSRKLALFVFIDALGWEIHRKNPFFLEDVLTSRRPLKSVFGYSCTCDPTILTGRMPRDHGHFSFFAYAPAASPFRLLRPLGLLPKSITRRGRVRRLMSRFIKRLYGYTGYFQIYNMPFDKISLFEYTEKRDLYEPCGINSGVPTIFDYLREHKIPYHLSDWRASEESNLASLGKAIRQGDISFAYLYMAAMDATLHAHGTDSPLVTEKIRWYDARIRELLDAAREKYDDVHLHIFSDHGMTDIHDTCDLKARVEALGLRYGTDYAVVYDSTMARFWIFNDDARARIVQALAEEPKGRILGEEELAELGCDFPDKRYGDLFFLMNPGVLLCPSYMGETVLAGMHGYHPDDKDTDAFFATNQPLANPPHRLDDLYALMLAEASGQTAD